MIFPVQLPDPEGHFDRVTGQADIQANKLYANIFSTLAGSLTS